MELELLREAALVSMEEKQRQEVNLLTLLSFDHVLLSVELYLT